MNTASQNRSIIRGARTYSPPCPDARGDELQNPKQELNSMAATKTADGAGDPIIGPGGEVPHTPQDLAAFREAAHAAITEALNASQDDPAKWLANLRAIVIDLAKSVPGILESLAPAIRGRRLVESAGSDYERRFQESAQRSREALGADPRHAADDRTHAESLDDADKWPPMQGSRSAYATRFAEATERARQKLGA